MGLDITGWSKLKFVSSHVHGQDFGGVCLHQSAEFAEHAADLKDGAYLPEPHSENVHIRMSYTNYNRWREWLCVRVAEYGSTDEVWLNKENYVGKPFIELIDFTDCDGTIGPKFAAKLAKDFAQFEPVAKRVGDDYDYETYKEFKRAFELAADNGAVEFA